MRTKKKHREYMRAWRKANPEKVKIQLIKKRQYKKNNKDKINKRANDWYHKKYKGTKEYYDMIQKNRVRCKTRRDNEKTGICERCNKEEKTNFHHLCYEPNIFIELCETCHKLEHGYVGEGVAEE